MNQKFNLKANNFIKNMLRYSYLIIIALLLNAVVNEIIVSANKIISVNIDYMLSGEAVDINSIIDNRPVTTNNTLRINPSSFMSFISFL